MRVCFLFTHLPQRCGIATYTAALAHALADDGGQAPQVIAELGAAAGDDHGVVSWPVFDRRQGYGSAVVQQALALGADVLHIQHSPDILGMDKRVLWLVQELRRQGIATVVTLHTVHNPTSAAIDRRFGVVRFHRQLAEVASQLVVHGGPAMRAELIRQGVAKEKICEIAHGTPALARIDKPLARQKLGLRLDAKVMLSFGFIHPQKNLHTIIQALSKIRRKVPNVLLYIAGSLQNHAWFNQLYLRVLHSLISRQSLSEHVIFREQFVPADEVPLLYGAADVVALPYAQGYGSASGIAHHAIGAHRIPLCSRSPKFSEIGAAIDPSLILPTYSPVAWADALVRLFTDETRSEELTQRVVRYASETAWPEVARAHRQLYRSVVARS